MRTKLPLLLALLLSAPAPAGDSPPSTARLVEQLGSKDFTKRERASQMLRARGPAVLPALRKALKHPDAEVRRRAGALIPVLEAIAALAPKRVTLNAERQPLADVLKEIEKQTGYKVAADGAGPNERCTVRLQAVPFWEALEQIGERTGRAATTVFLEDGIHLKARRKRPPFVTLQQPFRLEATRFHEDRDIDFSEPGTGKAIGRHDHLLTLTLSILAEPKFVLLSVGKVQVEIARDENGKSLTAVAAPPKREPTMISLEDIDRKPFQHMAKVLLRRSSPQARTLKELRGFVTVEVMVKRNPVVITDKFPMSKGTKHRLREGTVEVTEVVTGDGNYGVHIAVPSPQKGRRRYWEQRVHLEDAAGNRYHRYGSGWMRGGESYSISASFKKPDGVKAGPATRLIVEDWIILHHAIPFEFKDVLLP